MLHSIDQMRARLQMVQGFIEDWSFRKRKKKVEQPAQGIPQNSARTEHSEGTIGTQ